MEIREMTQKNDYSAPKTSGSFLQSWEWGEFQAEVGNRPIRLAFGDHQHVQGFEHRVGPLSYLYLPRVQQLDSAAMESLTAFAKGRKYAFVRIEPISPMQVSNIRLQETSSRQPKDTLILDLTKSEDELLQDMHSKTRYNIRLAERKGVTVESVKDIDVFWQLNEQTTARDQFKSHDKEYYRKMLALNMVHLLIGYYDGSPIAANIFIHAGNTFTYLHGTSSNVSRNVMAPYWLQWEGMMLGKKLGCTGYDFWGVAPPAESKETRFHKYSWDVNHKWTGVTRFKAGFGGKPVSYGQAVDMVVSPWKYKVYSLAKKVL